MTKKISLKIKPCKKNIGAELVCNLNKIHKNQIKLIKNSLNKYGLIFFRNQSLNPTNYIKFAKKFGKLAKYPRLKGLSKKYPQITVVQRKATDKGPSFGEQFHTDSSYTKKPPKFTMLLSKQVPKLGLANTEFSSQYLAYKDLHSKYKKKLSTLSGIYSSQGPIAVTTVDRTKEKGKLKKELIAKHKLIKKIKGKKTIYCSPGHLINFSEKNKKDLKLKNYLINHQIKKNFQYSLEWEKDQLAIWDNRSMLHQATPFNGRRKMYRITIK